MRLERPSGRARNGMEEKVQRAGEAWEIVRVPGACTQHEAGTVHTL